MFQEFGGFGFFDSEAFEKCDYEGKCYFFSICVLFVKCWDCFFWVIFKSLLDNLQEHRNKVRSLNKIQKLINQRFQLQIHISSLRNFRVQIHQSNRILNLRLMLININLLHLHLHNLNYSRLILAKLMKLILFRILRILTCRPLIFILNSNPFKYLSFNQSINSLQQSL